MPLSKLMKSYFTILYDEMKRNSTNSWASTISWDVALHEVLIINGYNKLKSETILYKKINDEKSILKDIWWNKNIC